MNKVVKVKLWGTLIGAIGYPPEQNEIATFEYNKDFVSMGVELSPITVPTKTIIHSFDNISKHTFHGLPGFIADALPDKFGNQLIDQYFAKKGINPNKITALDRLLYVGNRAMGALEFEPSEKLSNVNSNIQLNLNDLAELAEMLLDNKKEFTKKLETANKETAISLFRIGSSAGGARSKALVAIDNDGKLYDGTIKYKKSVEYYLLKFDSISNSDRDNKDPKGMTRIEYIYSLIAKNCGIDIPDTNYIKEKEDFHFLIKRFDRFKNDKGVTEKLHYVSWSGISHSHRETTGAFGYEQLVMTARELGLGQDSILEIFKRAIFNIVGRNQDDHTKNFGFLMNKEAKWSLSPAFDMTYSYDPEGKWTRTHQITLNGKQDTFSREDIITFGKYCNLSEKESGAILAKTVSEFSKFENLATKYGVDIELKKTISNNLRKDI